MTDTVLQVRHRLSTSTLEVHGPSGALIASHVLAPAGSGIVQRLPEHRAALETAVLAAFTTARPVTARPTGRPVLRLWPKRPDCSAPTVPTWWSTWPSMAS